jgi:hypothetical protein
MKKELKITEENLRKAKQSIDNIEEICEEGKEEFKKVLDKLVGKKEKVIDLSKKICERGQIFQAIDGPVMFKSSEFKYMIISRGREHSCKYKFGIVNITNGALWGKTAYGTNYTDITYGMLNQLFGKKDWSKKFKMIDTPSILKRKDRW